MPSPFTLPVATYDAFATGKSVEDSTTFGWAKVIGSWAICPESLAVHGAQSSAKGICAPAEILGVLIPITTIGIFTDTRVICCTTVLKTITLMLCPAQPSQFDVVQLYLQPTIQHTRKEAQLIDSFTRYLCINGRNAIPSSLLTC